MKRPVHPFILVFLHQSNSSAIISFIRRNILFYFILVIYLPTMWKQRYLGRNKVIYQAHRIGYSKLNSNLDELFWGFRVQDSRSQGSFVVRCNGRRYE